MSWKEVMLGDFITIKHGYAFDGKYFSDSGDYILLTPGNCFESGGLKLKGDKEKYFIGEISQNFVLSKGDLIVVMTDLIQAAPILGGAFLIPRDNKFLHNQRLGLVSIKENKCLDKKFLYYVFNTQSYRDQIRGSASGATVRHTAPERIYKCTFPLPPLPTQTRIAAILSAYDDLIEVNNRRIRLLEDAARQLYQEWFVRLRFPGHEQTPVHDGLPEGWERIKASEAIDVLSGGTPKTTVTEYWDGDIPFFTPKDCTDSPFVLFTEKNLTASGLKNCNSRLFAEDTVFITARGTVGNLQLALVPMAMNQSCYALIGKRDLGQFYVYSALESEMTHLKSQAVGAVFSAIIVKTFEQIQITVPEKQVLEQFNLKVTPIFQQMKNLIFQNQKLRQARDLLLPRLMRGELLP